jgi:hypothetical protein
VGGQTGSVIGEETDHGPGLVEVDGVGLEVRFGRGFIWVLGALDQVETGGLD